MDGRIVRGRQHAAGQIGHMPMPGATGLCVCSRVGCLDTLASGRAILAKLDRLSSHADSSKHGPSDAQALRDVVQEADRGNRASLVVMHEAGRHLGTALAWAAATLQPDLVVLAGVPSRSEAYIKGVMKTYAAVDAAPVAICQIPNETAAAELALDAFVYAHGFDLA